MAEEQKREPLLKGYIELNINGYIVKQDVAIWDHISKENKPYYSGLAGGNRITLFRNEPKQPLKPVL